MLLLFCWRDMDFAVYASYQHRVRANKLNCFHSIRLHVSSHELFSNNVTNTQMEHEAVLYILILFQQYSSCTRSTAGNCCMHLVEVFQLLIEFQNYFTSYLSSLLLIRDVSL